MLFLCKNDYSDITVALKVALQWHYSGIIMALQWFINFNTYSVIPSIIRPISKRAVLTVALKWHHSGITVAL